MQNYRTMHTTIYLRSFFSFILLTSLLGMACRNEPQQVASNNQSPKASATPTATPSPVPSSTPVATPAISPTVEQAQQGPKEVLVRTSRGTLPITISPAEPRGTPTPEPFPPRPTPTIVMKDGKIVQEWEAPPEALSLVSPVKNDPNAASIGRQYYMQRCADCHGREGKGNGLMSKTISKPPTNLASQRVQANTDGELYWKITNGRSPMPANHARFTDEQRWYIVAYLRTFKP
jgi:mono/diheme cytochrome c family protein